VSPSSDSNDQDIPELTDIMVTGRDHHDHDDPHAPHDPHTKAKRPKPHARKHGRHDEHGAHEEPQHASADDDDVPLLDAIYESPAPVHQPANEPAHEPAHAPAHERAHEPAQFVPGEAEFSSGAMAEHHTAPPEPMPAATTDYDADVLAERLRGRFATYLKGEGRNLIEARCRDAFQDHTTWLVNQITREVALALETEMVSWVREAIREELVKHAADK
jgi:hypothetical protein